MDVLSSILILCLILIAIFIYIQKFNTTDNIFEKNIYLDNNGTTQICSKALKLYEEGCRFGNASSIYATKAQEIIQKNDHLIKEWLHVLDNTHAVIYTSGASESNNTILKAIAQINSSQIPHFILSSYEHVSNLNCALMLQKDGKIQLTLIDPNIYGFINPEDVISKIQPNTILVSIMHINNETGNINDIDTISKLVKSKNPNIYFHCDAVQSFGKFSFPMNQIDAISVSYHKFYGPEGIGFLIVKNNLVPILQNHPLISGMQNYETRGGTMNIAGIYGGFGAHLEIMENRNEKNDRLYQIKKMIVNFLRTHFQIGDFNDYVGKPDTYSPAASNPAASNPAASNPADKCSYQTNNSKCSYQIVFMGSPDPLSVNMSPNTLLLSIIRLGPMSQHFCNIKFREQLLSHNIIVSIGSTCHSQKTEPSHVLMVLKAPYIIRCGIIRISWSDYTTFKDINKFNQTFLELLK